ncbi:MAG: hypothetical protein HYV63_25075 [Candidatus Schekmanbacteria bacterium]|nr:hypothetical protein [Candidatus Schekmanbacteria bacterium]
MIALFDTKYDALSRFTPNPSALNAYMDSIVSIFRCPGPSDPDYPTYNCNNGNLYPGDELPVIYLLGLEVDQDLPF